MRARQVLAGLLALCASSALAATAPEWRVVQGKVRVVCPLTVGGSFEATSPSLAGSVSLPDLHTPALEGELSVDLKTLDTGIGLRNDHLRDEYLEVGKGAGFDTAVLSDIRLGAIDPGSFQGRTAFTATLALHGAKRPIAGQAEIRRDGTSIRVEASFPVTVADFGVAKPRYLGVGVKSEVQVKVSLVATPVALQGASR